MAKFPGDSRIEQLSKAAKILQISSTNSLVHHQFHRSNSWLTISFQSQEKLNSCIKAMEALKDDDIRLIDISKKETYGHNASNGQVNKNTNK